MSETQGTSPALELPRDAAHVSRLSIEVTRCGKDDEKRLRFTIDGLDVDQKQYVYDILHVVRQQRVVQWAEMYSKTAEVHVGLKPTQLVTDEVMTELAVVIGVGALTVTRNRLDITIKRHPW